MTYNTVKDHTVQYVQKTYKNRQDITILLRNHEKMDLTADRPFREQMISNDAVAARVE